MAFLLLTLTQANLFAQQMPYDEAGPHDQYGQPYSPDRQSGYGQPYSYSGPGYSEPGYAQTTPSMQPLDAVQLEQLVAPIALYPDSLVAQILAASTYPMQVADADRWRQAQGYAPPEQIAAGADVQNWDPSVKALTAFPQVLAQMDRNLRWTTDLGNAYYNQPQDVLEAVQVMRRRAQAAGSLESTPQEVVRYDEGNIELVPANPQVVYVPAYNPWTVYGEPVSPYPGFSLLDAIGSFFGSSPLRYGLGIAMAAFTHTPWGWLAWGLNWLTHALLFNNSDYFSHSTTVADWGFPHAGFHAYGGHRGFDHFARARDGGGWRRGEGGVGPWHTFARAPGMHAEGWGSGRFDRGFVSFRGERQSFASYNRSPERRIDTRPAFRSGVDRGWSGASNRTLPSYRASAGFPRGQFDGRSSGFLSRSSAKPSRSGGFHLGGGHSQKGFGAGRSNGFHFGGGHAPKGFGGSKSFGGGHSHGGGHSGGHGGGKHHR